jgi:hypothetical protein
MKKLKDNYKSKRYITFLNTVMRAIQFTMVEG